MIRCPVCRRFARWLDTTVDGLGDVVVVRAKCALHGTIAAEFDTYDEVAGASETRRVPLVGPYDCRICGATISSGGVVKHEQSCCFGPKS